MMKPSFASELQQFAFSVDIVNMDILDKVGKEIHDYLTRIVKVCTYEVRIPAGYNPEREPYVRTLWSYNGEQFTTPLHKNDGGIRGHTAYAMINNKPLWVVDLDKKELSSEGQYSDQWSNAMDLPPYRGWRGMKMYTSIVVPFGQANKGYLCMEFDRYIISKKRARTEFQVLATAIGCLIDLCEANKVQKENTLKALAQISSKEANNPLEDERKPRLFIAFPGNGDRKVIGAIKSVLSEVNCKYNNPFQIVSWDTMSKPGSIPAQLRKEICQADFGVCYFSEPVEEGESGAKYSDNANVLYEAGMLHALTSSDDGSTRWIPVREKESPKKPFDFASDRLIEVNRCDGHINDQELKGRLEEMLMAWLKDIHS